MKSSLIPWCIMALPACSLAEVTLEAGVARDRALIEPAPGQTEAAGADLLLFKENGNVLHGTFGGINQGLLWDRNDIDRPIRFDLPGVRQIVLGDSPGLVMEKGLSFVNLVSGDRIPAKIISLDDKSLVINSKVVGELAIPRPLVQSISPNPFGGGLVYSGPYSSDGWVILDEEGASPAPPEDEAEAEAADENDQGDEEAPPAEPSPWIHSGASFYNLGDKPLAFPGADMPDIGRLSFRVEWKGRINLNLALLSDFTRPVPAPDDEEADDAGDEEALPELQWEHLTDRIEGSSFQSVPWRKVSDSSSPSIYGSGYLMTLYSSYPSIIRHSFNAQGQPVVGRLNRQRISQSLTEQGEAEIEIRFDRKQGLILLYLDGEYAAQWNDLEGAPGDGRGLAIFNNSSGSRIKISEILITSWNGMKDSAHSMNHPSKDMVLLVNGTDRFSGDLTSIRDGVAQLKTDYVEAEIPVPDLARIVFKQATTAGLDEDPEALPIWDEEPLSILYQPYGVIKLTPSSASTDTIRGHSPFLGEIEVDLSGASVLRFTDTSPDLSDWFNDF